MYDGTEELFEQLGEIAVGLKECDLTDIDSSLQAMMADIAAYFLDLFDRIEACIKRRRIKLGPGLFW